MGRLRSDANAAGSGMRKVATAIANHSSRAITVF